MNLKKIKVGCVAVLCAVVLVAGCSGYSVLTRQTVDEVPAARYESIIKLHNPDGQPDKTLAGLVHVTGQATMCTDYPREEVIKSLDELTMPEKHALASYLTYVVRDGDITAGYVSIPVDYRIVIWRRDAHPECTYKVEVVIPKTSVGFPSHTAVVPGISAW